MTDRIVLASASQIRQDLLRSAAVPFTVASVKIDEVAIRHAMIAEGAKPRDIADTLAEYKARRGSQKDPDALIIGCDQVLNFEGRILAKPESPTEARAQLEALNGKMHQLLSAVVIYQNVQPLWRHVGVVRLTMRHATEAYLDDYLLRNWDSIRQSVGGYKLEEEGIRLFQRIDGDYHNVLGLPLLEILGFLTIRGTIPG